MDVKEFISRPSKYFKKPEDVLASTNLSNKQKLTALQNWKQTCIQLQKSSDEGMPGSSQTGLQAISKAITKLETEMA